LNNKISDKDKEDWQNFISKKEKLINKDIQHENKDVDIKKTKTIDLHGFSLEDANKVIEEYIEDCFERGINKIIVITGKGLRSKNDKNPYVSKELSILKNSVPEYIKSKKNLMKIIKEIKTADVKDGGQGAFYILLKKI